MSDDKYIMGMHEFRLEMDKWFLWNFIHRMLASDSPYGLFADIRYWGLNLRRFLKVIGNLIFIPYSLLIYAPLVLIFYIIYYIFKRLMP